jgi:hypothetical protein
MKKIPHPGGSCQLPHPSDGPTDQDYRIRWLVQKYSLPISLARTIAALAGFNAVEGR